MSSTADWWHKVPQQNDDMAWRIVDDECIIVDPQGSQATVLNPVGARIWELMDGKKTVTTILEQILEEYDVAEETARADASQFVEELIQRNLVRFSNEG